MSEPTDITRLRELLKLEEALTLKTMDRPYDPEKLLSDHHSLYECKEHLKSQLRKNAPALLDELEQLREFKEKVTHFMGVRWEKGAMVRRSKARQKWRDAALNEHKELLEEE